MLKLGKIYLIRHGQSVDNAGGIICGIRNKPLTRLGISQARRAGEKLINKKIEIIVSSPLVRAKQTAAILAKTLKIKKVHLEADLREREVGIMSGKTIKEIPQFADEYIRINSSIYFTKGRGVESFPAAFKRAKSILKKVKKAYIGKNVLLVSHGDLICMMLAGEKKLAWREALEKWDGIKNTQIFEL